MPRRTLRCDVCDKPKQVLACYTESQKWWVCDRCFFKADLIAATEAGRDNRWPCDEDFARLASNEAAPPRRQESAA
jgi:hypothetical protein